MPKVYRVGGRRRWPNHHRATLRGHTSMHAPAGRNKISRRADCQGGQGRGPGFRKLYAGKVELKSLGSIADEIPAPVDPVRMGQWWWAGHQRQSMGLWSTDAAVTITFSKLRRALRHLHTLGDDPWHQADRDPDDQSDESNQPDAQLKPENPTLEPRSRLLRHRGDRNDATACALAAEPQPVPHRGPPGPIA